MFGKAQAVGERDAMLTPEVCGQLVPHCGNSVATAGTAAEEEAVSGIGRAAGQVRAEDRVDL